MADLSFPERNQPNRPDIRPTKPIPSPITQMLADRLAIYRGETDAPQDDRDSAYSEMVNIFIYSYLRYIPGEPINIPENNTGSESLEIAQNQHALRARINFGRGFYGAISFKPSNFYLVGDEEFSIPYIMADVTYDFLSFPESMTIAPNVMRLDEATSSASSANSAHRKFWEKMKDEGFKNRVRTFKDEKEMDESMGVEERNSEHSNRASSIRQYVDLLVASFQALHSEDPLTYPDFQLGLRTLVTKGADEAMEVLANKQSPPAAV